MNLQNNLLDILINVFLLATYNFVNEIADSSKWATTSVQPAEDDYFNEKSDDDLLVQAVEETSQQNLQGENLQHFTTIVTLA